LKKEREKSLCLNWAQSDPLMATHLSVVDANVNLLNATAKDTKAWKKKAEQLWLDFENEKIFRPRNEKACWNVMPAAVKVQAYLKAHRAGLPWSVLEFDTKARARLSKLRMKKKIKAYKEDPKNLFEVNRPTSQMWQEFRTGCRDGEMSVEEDNANQLKEALAKVKDLSERLGEKLHRKYFVCLFLFAV
jgi:hypothetical protein